MLNERNKKIEGVLSDLYNFKKTALLENQYAVDANIEFFEASKSLWRYITWLLFQAPKLDPKRLLEINDLLSKYDNEMHRELIKVEKKKFPGLIEPLVKNLVDYITKQNRPMIIASMGSGGMEAERQIISRLLAANHKYRIIFIGIDQSSIAHSVAKDNLMSLAEFIDSHETKNLDSDYVDQLKSHSGRQYIVIYYQSDLFTLDKFFPSNYFDVSFHTLFKHHLNYSQKQQLDNLLSKLSQTVFEYDGFKSWLAMIPQTIVGWNNLIFLNAEIFSNLRFMNKKEVIGNSDKNQDIIFSKTGYYFKKF